MKTENPRIRKVVCNDSLNLRYYHGNDELHFQPITPEAEREMFRAAKAGDLKIREELIVRHLLFALKRGRRFCANKLPPDETTSAANEALMIAIDRFDPEYGSAFRSFLIPHIRAAIARCWRSREPVDYKHSTPPPPREDPGAERTVETSCSQTFEQDDHKELMKAQLLEIASTLSPRDQRIVVLHYVEKKNFAEIGRELCPSLSREGVRQIHDRILVLLRKKLVARGIKSSQ